MGEKTSDVFLLLRQLRRVAECADGFRLAAMDLEERGPGVIIGAAQSGWPAFRYATTDPALYQRAQRAATALPASTTVPAGTAHLE